ncbi:hypothetical protein FA13DRAFT_68859 [Coprinellus micaceus]|uniref:Uncharacterized protein n=1 Tax=Coprinellus micaceus TaxID=71717 RepID=A0A4Y7TJG8_COPMI|nr:hypothetical protein FA13DRAFT_68859 [Coprinellus micaceus]
MTDNRCWEEGYPSCEAPATQRCRSTCRRDRNCAYRHSPPMDSKLPRNSAPGLSRGPREAVRIFEPPCCVGKSIHNFVATQDPMRALTFPQAPSDGTAGQHDIRPTGKRPRNLVTPAFLSSCKPHFRL